MGMEFHRGRMLDHVHLHAADLEKSKRFYKSIAEALGRGEAFMDMGDRFAVDELYVDAEPQAQRTHIHVAFQAADHDAVARFHKAGLGAGGRDNGAPGPRDQYHPGYYAAFLLDPDGNNIEAVFHGPSTRTADSVVIRPA